MATGISRNEIRSLHFDAKKAIHSIQPCDRFTSTVHHPKEFIMKNTTVKKITGTTIIACGIAIVCFTTTRAQQNSRVTTPVTKRDHVNTPPIGGKLHEGPLNMVSIAVEGLSPKFEERIKTSFQGQSTPLSRLKSFEIFDNPNFQFNGWSIVLRETQQASKGQLVKVGVAPRLTYINGANLTMLGEVVEWYLLDQSGLHYLRSEPQEQNSAFSLISD